MDLIPVASKFNFYQQIRLLLRKLRDGHTPEETLLDEQLHITSSLSLDAPDGQIASITRETADSPVEITACYNGLTGALGALPTVYSEWMINRYYRYSDSSAKAFIDLFGHRLYCLDYLAWQKHNLCALAESQDEPPLHTAIQALTGRLCAQSHPENTRYASLFSAPVRSMVNLEQLLRQMFGVPAQIIPFTGGWQPVPAQECCQLGNPHHTLATAPMMGQSRLELHASFDVVLGPMTPEISRKFTAQGSAWRAVWCAIRDYVGPVVNFSVSLTIQSTDSAPRSLGQQVLGLNLCLGSNAAAHLYQVRLVAPTD
ncbi:type VI secretion system baseplate subunit TssG [Mangrovibacter phragmitis]|uniref:type VI secretion system baseplate subunit TssG n=1 Tax=Mangrovibacter phragmitis TaxID=1691903 RepID=UPI0035173031